jgi:hypothetical protein
MKLRFTIIAIAFTGALTMAATNASILVRQTLPGAFFQISVHSVFDVLSYFVCLQSAPSTA